MFPARIANVLAAAFDGDQHAAIRNVNAKQTIDFFICFIFLFIESDFRVKLSHFNNFDKLFRKLNEQLD